MPAINHCIHTERPVWAVHSHSRRFRNNHSYRFHNLVPEAGKAADMEVPEDCSHSHCCYCSHSRSCYYFRSQGLTEDTAADTEVPENCSHSRNHSHYHHSYSYSHSHRYSRSFRPCHHDYSSITRLTNIKYSYCFRSFFI
ncbi:hypothetical protein V1224_08165 [Lachnospiraceae bacterium JLR.KK008]